MNIDDVSPLTVFGTLGLHKDVLSLQKSSPLCCGAFYLIDVLPLAPTLGPIRGRHKIHSQWYRLFIISPYEDVENVVSLSIKSKIVYGYDRVN